MIDGTGDVDTYVVVGSWKSQRREQQASVSLEATSIMTANVEIGEAGVAKENNHWINTHIWPTLISNVVRAKRLRCKYLWCMVIKTTHFVNLIWPSDRAENNDFTRDRVTLVDIFELSASSFTHVAETGLEKHTHCLLKKDGMYPRTMIHRQPLGDD